jgi:hypothetical protein
MIKVDDLIGKGFQSGAMGPDYYDCLGIVIEVLKRANQPIPEDIVCCDYSRKAIEDIIYDIKQTNTRFTKIEQPEPFCIVALMFRPPFISHIGIAINKYEFLQALKDVGVIKTRLSHEFWKNRIAGFYLYK